MGPSRRAASSSASLPGGRFAFLSHGRAVVKALSTAASSASLCSTTAHQGARSRRSEAVGDEDRSRGSHHVDGRRRSSGAGRAASCRRVPAAPSSGCPRRRRWRCRRRRARPRWWPGTVPAGRASSGSASASSPTVVRSPFGPRRSRSSPVVAQKTSRERWASSGLVAPMVRHQRPETKRTEDSTAPLRLPAPGRTGLDDGPVVLGHRSEGGLDVAGPRHDHRGQAVGPPHPCRALRGPTHWPWAPSFSRALDNLRAVAFAPT